MATSAENTIREIDEDLDKLAQKGDEVVEHVNKAAGKTWLKVVSIARQSYGVIESIVKLAGGSISTVLSSIIFAGLSAIEVLVPIFTAEALTVVGAVQAALGFAQIGMASYAIGAAIVGQNQISEQINNLNSVFNGVSGLVGRINH